MANTIKDYIEPHLEIHESLAVISTAARGRASAVMVGPNYKLARYGTETVEGTPFTAAGTDIPLQWEVNGVTVPVTVETPVDTAYTSVEAEGLEATLATVLTTNSTASIVIDADAADVLRISPGLFYKKGGTGTLNALLNGAPISVGDAFYTSASDSGTMVRNTVVDIVGKKTAAVVSQPTAASTNSKAPAGFNVATVGTSQDISLTSAVTAFSGAQSTQYVLECTVSPATAGVPTGDFIGAEFSVYDTAGIDVVATIRVTAANQVFSVGTLGVQVKISKVSAKPYVGVGDKFIVSCAAASVSSTDFDGVLLDGYPITDLSTYTPGAKLRTEIRRPYSGALKKGAAWAESSDGLVVSIFANLTMFIPERASSKQVPFADQVGLIYPSFRGLIPALSTQGPIELSSQEDIIAAYGVIDMDNDIAFAANTALAAAESFSVFGVAVSSNDLSGYRTAWMKTAQSDGYYMFNILSSNQEIIQSAAQFAKELSKYDVMNYRKVYAGVDSPGEYVCCNTDSTGNSLRATVSADGQGNNVVITISDPAFSLHHFNLNGTIILSSYPGDMVMVQGVKYTIKQIISNTQALLVTGPSTSISPAVPVELWKADTPQNTADYLIGLANSLDTRRCTILWSDRPVNSINALVPLKYAASYMAGLRSLKLPQKSLTKSRINVLANAPRMHTIWDRKLLNSVAAGGISIVTQDSEDAACVIRHQLTTEVGKGPLYSEDNVTYNVDTILLGAKDFLEPLIGDMNVVDDTLITISDGLANIFDGFTASPLGTESRLGPQLVRYSDLTVRQDPNFYDRVITTVNLFVPLPLNQIAMYAVVLAADAQAVTAQVTRVS